MHGRLKISLMRWKNFIWQKQVNKYKLIYKQYDKYFYKNFSRKRLTANLFKRIVRFFATDEAAVIKQFKRSLTNRLPISVSALGLTLFERQTR
ncbi:hypothetical protein NEIPOLOT_01900 [Neisseria polysaccharea ATCC 43768]|nr:hypothetical protein NEIPOLOT_01900 [Neisseria polysaccharea ATCC 43768]